MMKKRILSCGLCCWTAAWCVMVMVTSGVASAALIASEDFDSYANGDLVGSNGGTGWAGAWSSADTLGDVFGGRFVGDSNGDTVNIRKLSSPIGADGSTVWMSYIGRNDNIASSNGWAGVQLFDSANTQTAGGTDSDPDIANRNPERLFTGDQFASVEWGMARPGPGGSQEFRPNDGNFPVNGVDSLLVFKLDFQAGAFDTVSMWINPNVSNLGAADDVISMDDLGTSLDEIRITHGNDGTAEKPAFQVDSLLLGETAADLGLTVPSGSGDFDGDLDVDGADFLEWQRELGTTLSATDLEDWETNFGTTSAVSIVTTVPEPASLLLCIMAIAVVSRRYRPVVS